jgi:hypothetical protein
MNLKHLTDKSLIEDLKFLVTREREFLARILHHLKELDKRRLYSDLGFSSLFDYCVRELGYSEGEAVRRIQAARLLADIPEIEKKIESGHLSLSNISQASTFFKQNDVELASDKKAVLEQLENLSSREGEKMLFVMSGEEKKEKETEKRISSSKVKVSIILSDKTLQALQTLKDLIGKELSYNDLIDYMADVAIKNIEKKKFKVLSSSKVSPSAPHVNRVIKSAVKKEVYLRDKKCTKCGSTRNLNFDHQIPFALGGKSDAGNIRLLCFNCNQRARMRAKL